MSTTTTNYGLIKPDTTDPILVGQLNDNMDTIDTVLKNHSDKIDAASLGIKYKGEVNYYADLPNSAEIGDAYTVKYAGSSGTTPDGTEYVWGTVSGTNQWINFSKDSYTKAEVDALLALKQNVLTTSQLAAVNSGIDSAKVEQIETNKNNISKALTLEIGNAIQAETDLNTYTTIGVYYAENINIARSLTNSPVNTSTGSPFRLEVMENNTSSRLIQKIYEPAIDNSTINVYIRAYTLSGWSPWYKVNLTSA